MSNELYHYGVLGMKWGVRRARETGGTYKYKSLSTKKWERRADKYSRKSREFEGLDSVKTADYRAKSVKASKIAARSAAHDSRMQQFAEKSRVGGVIATNVMLGAWGNKTYNSIQASGGTKGAAVTATLLNSALGIGPVTAAVAKSLYIRDIDD